jgi:hypothetical protein
VPSVGQHRWLVAVVSGTFKSLQLQQPDLRAEMWGQSPNTFKDINLFRQLSRILAERESAKPLSKAVNLIEEHPTRIMPGLMTG